MRPSVSRSLLMIALSVMGLVAVQVRAADEPAATQPVLISVEKIWDAAPHNAFTDLVRFNDQWVCAFREAPAHKGGVEDSRMRVVVSDDTRTWKPAGLLSDPRGDIRDAKMAVLPDGRLMLLTAIQFFDTSRQHHQSLVWTTRDLTTWDGPHDVGDPDVWMWGIKWHDGAGYSIGYGTAEKKLARLYQTRDALHFERVVDQFEIPAPHPNESAMLFDESDAVSVLLRCDPDHAFFGTSKTPYTQWTWKQTNARVGGPALTRTPDGRLLGVARLYEPKPRTSLFWIDPKTAEITECLTLPSGGDTSYAGLVWHEGILHISYYSSHEGKTSIYFAKVRVPDAK